MAEGPKPGRMPRKSTATGAPPAEEREDEDEELTGEPEAESNNADDDNDLGIKSSFTSGGDAEDDRPRHRERSRDDSEERRSRDRRTGDRESEDRGGKKSKKKEEKTPRRKAPESLRRVANAEKLKLGLKVLWYWRATVARDGSISRSYTLGRLAELSGMTERAIRNFFESAEGLYLWTELRGTDGRVGRTKRTQAEIVAKIRDEIAAKLGYADTSAVPAARLAEVVREAGFATEVSSIPSSPSTPRSTYDTNSGMGTGEGIFYGAMVIACVILVVALIFIFTR